MKIVNSFPYCMESRNILSYCTRSKNVLSYCTGLRRGIPDRTSFARWSPLYDLINNVKQICDIYQLCWLDLKYRILIWAELSIELGRVVSWTGPSCLGPRFHWSDWSGPSCLWAELSCTPTFDPVRPGPIR